MPSVTLSNMERLGLPSEARIALLENDMETLLGNGQPGLISSMKKELSELHELALKGRYVVIGMVVAMMAMMFLSGSGTVSLKELLLLVH